MVEKSKLPDPNMVTYTTLINAYCKNDNLNMAKEIFDSMMLRGVGPDLFALTSIINGYCTYGKIEEAMRLFREQKANIKPVSWTS